MDNSQKPIEELINSGLAEHFYRVFGVPLLFSNAPDIKATAADYLKKKGHDAYPFAIAKTTNLAISENSYKPNTLLRRGLHGGASADNMLTYRLNMIPLTTIFEFALYVQDFKGMRNFSKQWLISSIRNSLNFSITYGVADVDVKVQLEKTLAIPSREGGVTEVKEYVLVSSITVFGYMSEALQKSQAVTQLETDLAVLDEMSKTGGTISIYSHDWLGDPVNSATGDGNVAQNGAAYTHVQQNSSNVWVVNHNLNANPIAVVVDGQGTTLSATLYYPTTNSMVITLPSASSGRAFLNLN